MRVSVVVLFCAMGVATSAQAADIGGRIKLDAIGYNAGPDTIDAALGYENSNELAGQLRLELSQAITQWKFAAAWQIDARHGSAVERDHDLAANYPVLAYAANDDSYWDLTDEQVDSGINQTIQRLDRLNVSYTGTAFVARLGRQALTWGGGLVFHPLDLVNPFQPVATDTAYKRGTDMAYGQWLLDNGSDIQFVVVPHKRRSSADPDAGKTTAAVFANLVGSSLQWSVLLARDHADSVLGIGASGALGGAAWNLEAIPTRLDDGGTRTSGLMNISQAGSFLHRNLTVFAEFYHNGFGERGNDYTVAQLNDDLAARLDRGQLFVTGRDYLALGATWEWTPLLQVMPTLIANLHDHSALFDAQFNRSLTNNVSLKAGLRIPAGDKGSEFGGLESAAQSEFYLAQPAQGFLRLEAYF
jgi:hypothetical protein